jgi:hypothetical protein
LRRPVEFTLRRGINVMDQSVTHPAVGVIGWFKDTLHDAPIDHIDRYLYSNPGVGPGVSRVTCGFVVIGG